MVTPNCEAKINMPKKAIGKPNATQIANLKFKKSAKKNSTSSIPEIAFFVSNQVLSFSVVLRSLVTFN